MEISYQGFLLRRMLRCRPAELAVVEIVIVAREGLHFLEESQAQIGGKTLGGDTGENSAADSPGYAHEGDPGHGRPHVQDVIPICIQQ